MLKVYEAELAKKRVLRIADIAAAITKAGQEIDALKATYLKEQEALIVAHYDELIKYIRSYRCGKYVDFNVFVKDNSSLTE